MKIISNFKWHLLFCFVLTFYNYINKYGQIDVAGFLGSMAAVLIFVFIVPFILSGIFVYMNRFYGVQKDFWNYSKFLVNIFISLCFISLL